MDKLCSSSIKKVNFLAKVFDIFYVGGFAKCYEGTNLDNKKMCAIKVIEKSTLQKSRAKQKVFISH